MSIFSNPRPRETGPSRSISGALAGCTIECTLPTVTELRNVKDFIAPRSRIFSSASPRADVTKLASAAAAIRSCGFEPIPHVAARTLKGADDLEQFLALLQEQSQVEEVLLVAGDRDAPAGAFPDALSVLKTGLLPKYGIKKVSISGYPDGHPKIPPAALSHAMRSKLRLMEDTGLRAGIITQFCLDHRPIIAWLKNLRDEGIATHVSIGVAGPTSIKSLLRFALRCGVRASASGIVSGRGLDLLGHVAHDQLIHDLGQHLEAAGITDTSFHIFSFGGFIETASWIASHRAAGSGQ